MTIIKNILFFLGLLLLLFSFYGLLATVSSDKLSKSTRKLYKCFLIIGTVLVFISCLFAVI